MDPGPREHQADGRPRGLASEPITTPRQRITVDRRPGSLPDIRTQGGNITFVLAPAGAPDNARLVIRCAPNGELWVSIVPAAGSVSSSPDA